MTQPTEQAHLDVNMIELMAIVRDILGQPWLDVINALDVPDGETLCFSEAPAGKGRHHAYLGGLVTHLLEMWSFWLSLRHHFVDSELINDKSVLAGILAHDLHKANRMYKLVNDQIEYAVTGEAQLASAAQLNVALIPECARTDLLLLNVISHAEGGWAKDQAKWCTSLAKLVYLLDELSANVLARIDEHSEFDAKAKGFSLA